MSSLHPLLQQAFPQLGLITDPAGVSILAEAPLLSIPAGQSLFRVGDACQNYLLVVKGQVKVLGRSASGREIVLYRIQECGSCVLTTACLLGQDTYPAEGITETPVQAFAIPSRQFREALSLSEGLRAFIFQSYGARLSGLIGLVQQLAFERIDLRLARYLLEHGWDRIELQITHQDLATELGSAREVISRQLKQFEREGWVQLGRGWIRVNDLEGLRGLVAFQS
ncbi:MAG: CRP/FNR family transcriptional regulator [Motiliproteus sp.]|jgi:CRP/FNR family transcriptional regulator